MRQMRQFRKICAEYADALYFHQGTRSWIEAQMQVTLAESKHTWRAHVGKNPRQTFVANFNEKLRHLSLWANRARGRRATFHHDMRARCLHIGFRKSAPRSAARKRKWPRDGTLLFGEGPALLLRTCVCSKSGPAAKAAPPGKAALFSTQLCVCVLKDYTRRAQEQSFSLLSYICE